MPSMCLLAPATGSQCSAGTPEQHALLYYQPTLLTYLSGLFLWQLPYTPRWVGKLIDIRERDQVGEPQKRARIYKNPKASSGIFLSKFDTP